MEFAPTFGSIGDFIAICQLAIRLGQALGVGCGGISSSATDHQDLRKQLDVFVQISMHVSYALTWGMILLPSFCTNGLRTKARALRVTDRTEQVVSSKQELEAHSSLSGLCQTIQTVIAESGGLIKDALDRFVPKYGDSLQPSGSGNAARDALRKVEWMAREKDRFRALKEKLQRNTELLTLLVGIANQ